MSQLPSTSRVTDQSWRSPVEFQESPTLILAPIRICFLIYVFSMAFEHVDAFGTLGFFTITRLAGLVLAAVACLQPMVCFARPPRALWCFAAFLAVYTLRGLLQNPMGELTLDVIAKIFQNLVAFWICYNVLRYGGIHRATLIALAVSLALLAVLGYFGIATEEAEERGGTRATIFGLPLNYLAFLYAIGILAVLDLMVGKWKQFHWMLLGGPMILVMAVQAIRTGSRGGLLCAVVGILAYALGRKGLANRARGVILGSVVLAVLVQIALKSDAVRERFALTVEGGETANRDVIMLAAANMFLEKPVLGWGPTTHLMELADRAAKKNETGIFIDTHNDILYVVTATGLLGGLPFVLGLWLCLKGAWQARRGKTGPIVLALVIAALTAGLSVTSLNRKPIWLILAYGAAAPFVAGVASPRAAQFPRARERRR